MAEIRGETEISSRGVCRGDAVPPPLHARLMQSMETAEVKEKDGDKRREIARWVAQEIGGKRVYHDEHARADSTTGQGPG